MNQEGCMTVCPVHEKIFEIVVDFRAKQELTLKKLDNVEDILIRVVKIEERNQTLLNRVDHQQNNIESLENVVNELRNARSVDMAISSRRVFLITLLLGLIGSLVSVIPWIFR